MHQLAVIFGGISVGLAAKQIKLKCYINILIETHSFDDFACFSPVKMVSYDLYSTPNLKSFNGSPYFQINTK